MPSSSFENANLAANTKTANILAGDINEFVPFDAIVTIFAVASTSNVNLTILADSDVAIDDKEIVHIDDRIRRSDHLQDQFLVAEGTRLAMFLRETGGVATTDVLTEITVEPL